MKKYKASIDINNKDIPTIKINIIIIRNQIKVYVFIIYDNSIILFFKKYHKISKEIIQWKIK